MSVRWSSLACTIAIALTGCATADSPGARERSRANGGADGETARGALFAADAAQTDSIAKLGAVEGVMRPLRDDAIYLAEEIPIIRGKREIADALRRDNANATARTISRTLAGGDASADGRFGFTFGWLQKSGLAAGDATTYGTYVSTWTREGRGEPFRVAAYYTRASPGPHPPPRDGFPLLVAGSGAGGVPRRGALDQQRRSLLEVDAEFAAYSAAHGYTLAFATYAAEFAMAFGRNFFFLVGRQEVLDFYKGWTPAEVLEWNPLFADSSESGDLGYTVGTSVDTTTKPDGAVGRAYNKYLSLWARRADGTWRFVADGGASAPAPSSSSRPSISEGLSRVQNKPP
jgi:ketosteroid isomerase-like protein